MGFFSSIFLERRTEQDEQLSTELCTRWMTVLYHKQIYVIDSLV